MLIYKATNKINGKMYIGQTTKSLEDRITMHMRDTRCSNFIFHKAIRKYGIQSFEWLIIDTADCKEILNEKEIYWISYLNTKVPNGYNLSDGGAGGNLGSLVKRRKGCKRRPASSETKKKMSERRKGIHLSLGVKEKISKGLKGSF